MNKLLETSFPKQFPLLSFLFKWGLKYFSLLNNFKLEKELENSWG